MKSRTISEKSINKVTSQEKPIPLYTIHKEENQQSILNALSDGPLSYQILFKVTGFPQRTFDQYIQRLKKANKITKITCPHCGAKRKIYSLTK